MRRQRRTGTYTIAIAGCRECNGDEYIWSAKNAVGVAARHCDATGHNTWADQTTHIEYQPPGGEETKS